MPDPAPGSVIADKYELLAPLGEGGMGEVFEARHAVTGRLVAVKVLKAEAKHRGEAQRRFQREAQAIGRLEHPHVVEVLDAGIDDATGAPYIVQTLLRGVSLRAFLQTKERIAPPLAARVVAPILRGLGAAHAAGIVHRDIKPSNVFLCRRDDDPPDEVVPKIIDFGISKLAEGADAPDTLSTLTASGVVVGTVGYMAPEQAEGREEIDGRADLWAVGVMLYEMIAGRRPFDAPSTTVTLLRIVSHDPAPLADVLPDVPPALSEVVARSLRRPPDERWPTAAAMLEALEAALGEPLRASSILVPGVSAAQAAAPVRDRAASPRPVLPATAETAARAPRPGVGVAEVPRPPDVRVRPVPWLALAALTASVLALTGVVASLAGEPEDASLVPATGRAVSVADATSARDAATEAPPDASVEHAAAPPDAASAAVERASTSTPSRPTPRGSDETPRRRADAAVLAPEGPRVGAHGSPILGAD